MALLVKRRLLQVVEHSIRRSGWNLLYLSPIGTHPARYHVYHEDRSQRVRIYIWNLTRGGTNRPEDEWRIQVTGVNRFEQEIDGNTVILGWQDDRGLFVGFDYTRHNERLGHSPSIQIREAALQRAAEGGFAPHDKGNGELAIAFKPGFLATYIEHLGALHACGQTEDEVNVLRRISEQHDVATDEVIATHIPQPRRYAVVSARRAVRSSDFRERILDAYSHSCAMCNVQLDLLEGAHILPVDQPDSTDGTDNGVALCATHHRAYDRGLITFTPNLEIHVNDHMVRILEEQERTGGLRRFSETLNPVLVIPGNETDRPANRFVEAANELRGWLF